MNELILDQKASTMYDAQQIFRQKRRLSSTKKGIVNLHTVAQSPNVARGWEIFP